MYKKPMCHVRVETMQPHVRSLNDNPANHLHIARSRFDPKDDGSSSPMRLKFHGVEMGVPPKLDVFRRENPIYSLD